MRTTFLSEAERGRYLHAPLGYASESNDPFGMFLLRRNSVRFKVIVSRATDEIPWDHVSASTQIRTPTWDEMCWIKNLFFEEEEAVIQLHPPKSDHVNFHPHCLHLWRPTQDALPLPPSITVGPKGVTIAP